MSQEITFGNWLRQRRKELSITQEELAQRLDISWITLRKLESGERNPSGQVALLLAEHLGVPPDEHPAFVAFARTGRQASGAVNLAAPWRSTFVQQTNLPAVLTSLIGREQELAVALDHLRNPKTRLLTLIGAPGIGKTRLGLQVAIDLLAHFQDGAFFVDLSPVMDPELVLPAIARTLGLKDTPSQSLENVLLDHLRRKRMLLLLDNFEQVLDASRDVVKMMEASPWLKVLVTSREALQVRGERRFLVPPLAVPDLHRPPVLDEMMSYPSVELFVERAQAAAPEFALTEATAPDVAALCTGLEGLPLAIEIAASRANQFSPAEMRVGLANRLKLLKAVTRDLPTRQRTLLNAIEWSYGLLMVEERVLFQRLGVFVGGFTTDAVTSVCRSQDVFHVDAGADTVDILQSLVSKNLLRKEEVKLTVGKEGTQGSSNSKTRFGMLESIREYVRQKLEESEQPGDARHLEKKHALYYMAFAEEADRQLRGPGQIEWLSRVELEHNNLLAALNWARETSSNEPNNSMNEGREANEIGLRITAALAHFWFLRGYHRDGIEYLQAALSQSNESSPSPRPVWSKSDDEMQAVRARMLGSASSLEDMRGNSELALALQEESLAISRRIGYKEGVATSLNGLGIIVGQRGNITAAHAFFEESVSIWRELGIKHGEALALTNLGKNASDDGQYDYALARYEESLALWRACGNPRGIALCLTFIGFALYAQEKYDAAWACYEEGLTYQRELGNKWGIATLLDQLGTISFIRKDYPRSRTFHEESLAIFRELSHKLAVARTLHSLAMPIFSLGEHDTALSLLRESLATGQDIGEKVDTINNLAVLGGMMAAMRTGEAEAILGARLLGAASILMAELGSDWLPEDRVFVDDGTAAARNKLDDELFERAFAEGRVMSLEDAIAHALQNVDDID